jgi:NTE family protein
MGLLSSAKIEDLISRFTRKRQFSELNIPLAVVATKLMTGQPVVLKKGSILEAVRASCSIPELFAPVRVGKDLLVDGGIADNLPVGVVGEMGADLVVAVDCSPAVEPAEPKNLFQVAHRLAFLLGRAKIEQSRRAADVLISPEVGHVDSMDYARSRELISIGRIAAQRAMPQLRREIAKRRGFFYRLKRGIRSG